jgi:hypothetical protein
MADNNEIETGVGALADSMKGRKKVAKKGNRSWRPAAPLGIKAKDPSNRLRWVHAEPANMLKKRAEGWEQADVGDAVHDRPNGVESGSGTPAGVLEYRDMVLMKMPEEMAREREAYYRNASQEQVSGLKTRAKRDIRAKTGVTVEGDITID